MLKENSFIYKNIQTILQINDINLFEVYVLELYKDLSVRSPSEKEKGISFIVFHEYMKLPLIISEKLFKSFDKNDDSFLDYKEFNEGLFSIYFGDFDLNLSAIFKLLDFSKTNQISRHDVKLILTYLPVVFEKDCEFRQQIDSLLHIQTILGITFLERETLSFEEFSYMTTTQASDIFLHIMCFLFMNCPFNENTINNFRYFHKYDKESPAQQRVLSMNILPSPLKSNFMTNEVFYNLRRKETDSLLTSGCSKFDKLSSDDGDFIAVLNDLEEENKPRRGSCSSVSTVTSSVMEEVNYEETVYKLTKSKSLKSYYLVIMGKEIFYYKNSKKDILKGMHHLSGTYIKLNEERVSINNKEYYSFSIIFRKQVKVYYTTTLDIAETWVENLCRAVGNVEFDEHYELVKEIGRGTFGKVYKAKIKNTNKFVAIKILKKDKMTVKELEYLLRETAILGICHHENIVSLIDTFENELHVYIIMEYIPGNNLRKFIEKTSSTLCEKKAKDMVRQLSEGVNYLHELGIIHRDMKPDNILVMEKENSYIIKIIDFGLSKIMSLSEKTHDGVGTIFYVAPEVLLKNPYDSKVDVWALGVILYYILSKKLPFNDENFSEEKIAMKTIFSKVEFTSSIWEKRSKGSIELITRCLNKDPKKRISINSFLKDDWLNTNIV